MTASRDMLSDELVEAMESLHLYPRLIAERAAKEARRAALTELRAEVEGMIAPESCTPEEHEMFGPCTSYLIARDVLAAIDRKLGDGS